MTRCPHCHARGVYRDGDGRVVCLFCAQVYREPRPNTFEKMASNATRDGNAHEAGLPSYGPRQDAGPGYVERVMTRVKAEGRCP